MKKFFTLLAGTLLLLGLAGTSMAVPLLSDNFNTENGGIGTLNYNSFTKWTVGEGTVDLIGNGYFDFLPGNGLYVDMDGSRGSAGKLTTLNPLNLQGGQTYIIQFDLAGNHRNGAYESVNVLVSLTTMEPIYQQLFSLSQNDPFTTYTRFFTPTSDQTVFLSFEASGGDYIGMLLDNVVVDVAPAPEPATMLLLGSGLLGLAGFRKKFRK